MPAPTDSSDHATRSRCHRSGFILALVCLAQFMVVLDISIVNVALPSMKEGLRFDDAGLQWVVNAYTLAFAGFLLLGGRAADLFGQRKLFLLGASMFGIASVVGGAANSQGVLIAARSLQGLGGAILSPATLTILTTTFTTPKDRARAMGLWGAIGGAGGASGALLGGTLTDLVGWRSIFFLNIPIALIAVVAGWTLLRTRNERHATSLDIGGAVLVTGGLVGVVYGIVSTEQYGWMSWQSSGAIVIGALLLVAFAFNESRIAKEPLMPLSLWRIPALAIANLTMFFIAMGMFAMWYFVSLDLQLVREYSPLKAGLTFVPQTIAIMVGAQLSSRIMQSVGPRNLAALAALIAAIGTIWLAQTLDASNVFLGVMLPGAVITFGLGMSITPVITSAMAGVDRTMAGLASGLINTSRQVGGSIGLAVLITIANDFTHEKAPVEGFATAATAGYERGLTIGAVFLLAAAASAMFLGGRARTNQEAVNPAVGLASEA